MSDLRIKPNIENGDLPKQMELFDDGDREKSWINTVSADSDEFHLQLADIFNPLKMKEALDKSNGRTNKDKDKQ